MLLEMCRFLFCNSVDVTIRIVLISYIKLTGVGLVLIGLTYIKCAYVACLLVVHAALAFNSGLEVASVWLSATAKGTAAVKTAARDCGLVNVADQGRAAVKTTTMQI